MIASSSLSDKKETIVSLLHKHEKQCPTQNEIDGAMAEELLKMSFTDRNDINEEIHGVKCLAIKETPKLIKNALRLFQTELERLPNTEKQAFLFIQKVRQHQCDPFYAAYAYNQHFRLRFLRCCLFKVHLAVRRFANYLNFIQTYWGDAYLAKPIQLSDLNATETKLLKQGEIQILPFRDRSGRRVIANLGDANDMEGFAFIKAWFYILDVVSRDSLETQQNGVISLLDGGAFKNSKSYTDFNLFSFAPETKNWIASLMKRGKTMTPLIAAHHAFPTRVVCVHFCWPYTPIVKKLLNFYLTQTDLIQSKDAPFELSRVKIHSGEETEMRYKVKSYGVPIELLPLTGTNVIKVNYHNQWIKTRKLVEGNQLKYQMQSNCGYIPEYECRFGNPNERPVTIVECPCSNDVVFRNGTQSNENPGNAMFRNFIRAYWEKRQAAVDFQQEEDSTDEDDRRFRDDLVRTIETQMGGRFLEWDKSRTVWIKMEDKAKIQRKVSMAFYNCTKRRYRMPKIKVNKRRGRSNDTLAYQFIEKKRAKEGTCCFNTDEIASAGGSTSGSDDDIAII